MFINSEYFSDLANSYKKNNNKYPFYDDYMDIYNNLNRNNKKTDKILYPTLDMMPYEAQDFAIRWIKLFINGYEVGGKKITGEHLFYLNCNQIIITEEINKDKIIKSKRAVGKRIEGFPSFWDEDFKYFWTCEIAKYGISKEDYIKLCINNFDLELVEEEDNLSGGLNHLWLKPRGVGASWKGASKANYNQFLKPSSNTFIFANTKEYLGGKDGFFTKYTQVRNFIQSKCWFLRKDFTTESITEFLFQTNFKEKIGGANIDSGFNSKVAGIVVDNDSDKGRGKRGDAIFEEFGSFPNVDKVWNKYEESANEYGIVHGQARGFGTGGDSKTGLIEGYQSLKTMFYEPKSYNIIRFKDVYEDIGAGRDFGMFTPSYKNITDKDNNGNSLIEIGKEKLDARRLDWLSSKDGNLYIEKCAELPYIPSEAFSNIGGNIFAKDLIEKQIKLVEQLDVYKSIITTGIIKKGVFYPTNDKPYLEYPIDKKNNVKKDSCVCIFKKPFKNREGLIPDNLYLISVDSYRSDVDGTSIGSIYILENINTFTETKGDIITAWYNGRPSNDDAQNKFCEILFGLAELYNAKIGLEVGAESFIISYAKNINNNDSKGRKLLRYLQPSFENAYDLKIKTKKNSNVQFGMGMNKDRKDTGLLYLSEWIKKVRAEIGDDVIRNINYIFDIGLLKELLYYNGRNADRISSMIIAVYYLKELSYKKQQYAKKQGDSFFNTKLF